MRETFLVECTKPPLAKEVIASAALPVECEGSVSCCVFSSLSQQFAVTFSLSDTTYIFQLLGTSPQFLLRHSGTLRTCCWAPENEVTASGSEDGSVKAWDLADSDAKEIFNKPKVENKEGRVRSLAINSTATQIAISTYSTNVEVSSLTLDYQVMHLLQLGFPSKPDYGGSPFICSQGDRLYCGSDDSVANLYVWNWNDLSEEPLVCKGHTRGIRAIAASEKFVATGSYDYSIIIWTLEGNLVWRILQHADSVFVLRFLQDQMLASGSADTDVILYDLESKRSLLIHSDLGGWIRGISPLYSSQQLAIVTGDKRIHYAQIQPQGGSFMYWLLSPLFILYYVDILTDAILLASFVSQAEYVVFALSIFCIIFPNILEALEDFTSSNRRTAHLLVLVLLDLCFLKYFYSFFLDVRTPCYQQNTRIKRNRVRRMDIFKTLFESMPQSAISLWFILKYARYSVLPLLTFSTSILGAASTLSFGLGLQWNFVSKVLLLIYRVMELVLRVGLLALTSLEVETYFPFYLTVVISLLQALIITPGKSNKKQTAMSRLLHICRCFANSIAFVYSEVPTTQRDKSGQLVNSYTNTVVLGLFKLPIKPSAQRNFIAPNATQVHALLQLLLNTIINVALLLAVSFLTEFNIWCLLLWGALGCQYLLFIIIKLVRDQV